MDRLENFDDYVGPATVEIVDKQYDTVGAAAGVCSPGEILQVVAQAVEVAAYSCGQSQLTPIFFARRAFLDKAAEQPFRCPLCDSGLRRRHGLARGIGPGARGHDCFLGLGGFVCRAPGPGHDLGSFGPRLGSTWRRFGLGRFLLGCLLFFGTLLHIVGRVRELVD